MTSRIQDYFDAAIAVSELVDAGADLFDPATFDQLNALIEEFKPNVVVGDDNANDLFAAPFGLNYVNGLGGDDILIGAVGTDALVGGDGDDFLSGGAGFDALFGSAGADRMFGGNGRDYLDGGAGDDSLSGDNGRDELFGEEGADTLDGGNGRDRLDGGAGADTLTGGKGRDEFAFSGDPFDGADVSGAGRQVIGAEDFITDFDANGREKLLLDADDFGVDERIHFAAIDANAPDATVRNGANVIVLLNDDDDGDPLTAFNAGRAADQVAGLVEADGAGFFVYFNSSLGVNRLVFSENLNDPTADLKIVARFTNDVGEDAVAALGDFGADNFALI